MKYIISNDVSEITLENELVLFKEGLGESDYFSLNSIGVIIWNSIKSNFDELSIISNLLNEFDVDENLIKEDVSALLSDLLDKGLIAVA